MERFRRRGAAGHRTAAGRPGRQFAATHLHHQQLARQAEIRAYDVPNHRAESLADILGAAKHLNRAVAIDIDADGGLAAAIAPVARADAEAALDRAGRSAVFG